MVCAGEVASFRGGDVCVVEVMTVCITKDVLCGLCIECVLVQGSFC